LGVVSGLLSMTARPTPNGEPTTDPWQWLHDNEFSWDDVNAVAAIFVAAIFELGGWDVVKSEARATAPAGLDAETFTGILGWSNKRTGVEFYRSWDEGRWGKRQSNYDDSAEPERGGWGVLLADDIETRLKHAEGRAVVVLVAKDRRTTGDSILAALAALAADSEPVEE
jgi:hypothetical protein